MNVADARWRGCRGRRLRPALPTAMTMRPQLASSPAIGGLDQRRVGDGEARCCGAARALSAPADLDRDELGRALAVASRPGGRGRAAPPRAQRGNRASRGRRRGDRGAPRAAAVPVANSSSVSLVEVSPSTVMQLKVSSAPSRQQGPAAPRGRSAASVTTKASMVAMSGRDHARRPWQMPLMVHRRRRRSRRVRVASLGRCRWS